MDLCIDATELRRALAEIERAEANGFHHCLATFWISSGGRMVGDCRLRFDDLLERGHPTDPGMNWGMCQSVTKRYRLVDGELVPIEGKE